MKKVIIPLPAIDFDPTEAGVSWKVLRENQVSVVFATPDGKAARGDARMITGEGLGIWSPLLKADRAGKSAYSEMLGASEFRQPVLWRDIRASEFDGIVLPGGHAPGMKDYLESTVLQSVVTDFFSHNKVVGAICHGVVLAARSKDVSGKSILSGRKSTALLRTQELSAWALTFLWLKNYYRTYPETVQTEVIRHLGDPSLFLKGPIPLKRDSMKSLENGFVVREGNYVSARWPGDAHRFASTVVEALRD